MPNLNHLEMFSDVVDAGGMVDAAPIIGLSYSAINKAMRALEDEIGGKLFERRPFKLTGLGMRWYEPASNYKKLVRNLGKRAKTEKDYTFILGGSEYVMDSYTLLITEMIQKHGGNVNYNIDTCQHDEVVDALLSGRIDVAIAPITRDLPVDIEVLKLMTLNLVLLVPDTPAYARIRSADYFLRQGTVQERLFLPHPGSAIVSAFKHGLRLETVHWPHVSWIKHVGVITKLVAAGRGIGLSVDLPSLIKWPGVRAIRLPGLPSIDYGLLWNRATREHCSPAVKVLKASADTRFRVTSTGTLLTELLKAAVQAEGQAKPASKKAR